MVEAAGTSEVSVIFCHITLHSHRKRDIFIRMLTVVLLLTLDSGSDVTVAGAILCVRLPIELKAMSTREVGGEALKET
jgi:hypothetical protein